MNTAAGDATYRLRISVSRRPSSRRRKYVFILMMSFHEAPAARRIAPQIPKHLLCLSIKLVERRDLAASVEWNLSRRVDRLPDLHRVRVTTFRMKSWHGHYVLGNRGRQDQLRLLQEFVYWRRDNRRCGTGRRREVSVLNLAERFIVLRVAQVCCNLHDMVPADLTAGDDMIKQLVGMLRLHSHVAHTDRIPLKVPCNLSLNVIDVADQGRMGCSRGLRESWRTRCQPYVRTNHCVPRESRDYVHLKPRNRARRVPAPHQWPPTGYPEDTFLGSFGRSGSFRRSFAGRR